MNYKLIKTKKNLNQNYKIICNKISSSIFVFLGFKFFKELVLKNFIHIYNVQLKNKTAAIITVVEYENYLQTNSKSFRTNKKYLFFIKIFKKKL